jgi:hypothetical protein
MSKALVLAVLLTLCAVSAIAQPPADKLPTVTTMGNTNPEAISDINAQLIWLIAAAPPSTTRMSGPPEQAIDQFSAGMLYRFTAFPAAMSGDRNTKLMEILGNFRSAYDSLINDFNAGIASVPRDDIWKVYRDLRVKTNDLVVATIRTLNNTFPENADSLRNEIQRARDTISVSTYKSSSDPDYANNPRTAATGFAWIQGGVSVAASDGKDETIAHWITVVIEGMVPGCPGKLFPTATIDGKYVEGPKIEPVQYMDFQKTVRSTSSRPGFLLGVKCAIQTAR